MPKPAAALLLFSAVFLTAISTSPAQTAGTFGLPGRSTPVARYTTAYTTVTSAPRAHYSGAINTLMIVAAGTAEVAAEKRSTGLCWRYVKQALVKANAVSSYPQTAYAREAGRELTERYGFRRLPVRSPLQAPVGAVLVYGGTRAGHVEIRTPRGYVSDYRSRRPCALPFLGAYARVQ